ncbi:hypothetical protein [Weissella sp. MSCH1]|uniref:hypothetical protein n=1 Tax=Weissella sp. MSCH1 TaxID=3383343 RepID=UPI0038968DA5
MIYYRWIIGPLVLINTLAALLIDCIFRYYPLVMLIPVKYAVHTTLRYFIILVFLWFFINLITGQLKRDLVSASFGIWLSRFDSSITANTSKNEISNFWLKTLRIKKSKNNLVLRVFFGFNGGIANELRSRLNENIEFLNKRFPDYHFSDVEMAGKHNFKILGTKIVDR